MNVDDEIDRRLLRNARELRGVPIEPPPLHAATRSPGRTGVRSLVLATCAVLLAVGGGIAIWAEVVPPTDAEPVTEELAATVETLVAPAVPAEPRPRPSRPLLDGYDEVAMIGQVADRFSSGADQRPLPPGVV